LILLNDFLFPACEEPKLSMARKFKIRFVVSWSRKLRVASPDKQTSMHAPRFSTQS